MHGRRIPQRRGQPGGSLCLFHPDACFRPDAEDRRGLGDESGSMTEVTRRVTSVATATFPGAGQQRA